MKALTIVLCLGCASTQKLADQLIKAPAIELALHGGHADWVRKLAAANDGVSELDGVAMGCVLIYLTPNAAADQGLRRHEYHHCIDWRADPLGFPVKYAEQTKLVGYDANPYEVAARMAQDNELAPTADADK